MELLFRLLFPPSWPPLEIDTVPTCRTSRGCPSRSRLVLASRPRLGKGVNVRLCEVCEEEGASVISGLSIRFLPSGPCGIASAPHHTSIYHRGRFVTLTKLCCLSSLLDSVSPMHERFPMKSSSVAAGPWSVLRKDEAHRSRPVVLSPVSIRKVSMLVQGKRGTN